MANGYELCEAVAEPLRRALVGALRLTDATPLDNHQRKAVDELRQTIAKARRIADELAWEAWNAAN